MNCKYCHSKNVQKRGLRGKKQTYQCSDCRGYFRDDQNKTIAKVLLFDIETLPMEFYGWKLWDMVTSPEFIIRDWCVLSYAAKWLYEPEVMTRVLTPKEALSHNDKKCVEEIWELFEKSDVVIAHNGVSFDLSKMNSRYLYYGLTPTTPYQNIDTFLTAKKAFGFSSNALDYLGEYLGLGRKHKTDFEWWRKCAEGDAEYLKMMNEYNVRDITLLEDVYVKLRPWIKHPNMGLYMNLDTKVSACPRCGSLDLDWKGEYRTDASVFDAFRCSNCGGIGRAKSRKATSSTSPIQSL